MPRTAPVFGLEVSVECMERIIDFVLHYECELTQAHEANGRLTTHEKSQRALLRRMLLDLGIDTRGCVTNHARERVGADV